MEDKEGIKTLLLPIYLYVTIISIISISMTLA